jgi:putative oxidoreductase
MERFLGRYAEYVYAIFRIVVGFLFMLHGAQKLFGWPPSGRPGAPLEGMMLVAGIIEFSCGALVLIGLLTSIAAFIASGMMAVAYFMVHQPMGALPIQNNGEPAVLFCFAFLFIAARGAGLLSADHAMRGTRPLDS